MMTAESTTLLEDLVRMLRTAFRELLEGVPDPQVADPIHEAVRDLRGEFGLPDPQGRIGKLGELHTDPAWDQ
jgi:hypothetical protein